MPVSLVWEAIPTATIYYVYRTTDLSVPYLLIGQSTSTSYTDATTVRGLNYYYYVVPYNGTVALSGGNQVYIGANQQRVGKICTKIARRIKDKGANSVTPDEMIAEMTQVQLELCRKYLAYKTEFALSMVSGQMNYPIMYDIYKIKNIILPVTWKRWHRDTGLEIISDAKIWARLLDAKAYDLRYPQKVFVWNRVLRLWPAPAVTGDIVVCWAYALPNLDLVYLGDPEIGIEWDDCLENGTFYRITGDKEAQAKYMDDASTIAGQNYKETVAGDDVIEYSARYLGC